MVKLIFWHNIDLCFSKEKLYLFHESFLHVMATLCLRKVAKFWTLTVDCIPQCFQLLPNNILIRLIIAMVAVRQTTAKSYEVSWPG